MVTTIPVEPDVIGTIKGGGVAAVKGGVALDRPKKNTLWISMQSVIPVNGSTIFLQVGQILNMMPESILLPISNDIRKIFLLLANIF